MPRSPQPKPECLQCPFTVLIDSREQAPYAFLGLRSNADEGNLPIIVPTMRVAMVTGDYGLFGLPRIAIERKSKEDLFASVARRDNFEDRLERMTRLDFAAVVIEAEFSEIMTRPPKYTKYQPKSLMRTLMAWMIRYRGVHWLPMPDRWAAEQATFRLIERYWKDHQLQQVVPAEIATGASASQ